MKYFPENWMEWNCDARSMDSHNDARSIGVGYKALVSQPFAEERFNAVRHPPTNYTK